MHGQIFLNFKSAQFAQCGSANTLLSTYLTTAQVPQNMKNQYFSLTIFEIGRLQNDGVEMMTKSHIPNVKT